MKIYYGIDGSILIDVTAICLTNLMNNNIITIPANDHNRAYYFTDPLVDVLKKIYIDTDDLVRTEYSPNYIIIIDIVNKTIKTTITSSVDIISKTSYIQSQLKLNYGSFNEELPEQKMVVRYFTGKEKVLEIGGNIGRNSLIIAYILNNNNNNNFVTLECDSIIAMKLIENRDLNNFNFFVEISALSNRKLIQHGWDTIPSDVLLPECKWVATITLDELHNKYNIDFDTLILDCEGAFYYILMDMPDILNNIKLIIMENDYWHISQKNYVDDILTKFNFRRDYVECGGWGPCYDNFYEVWVKI